MSRDLHTTVTVDHTDGLRQIPDVSYNRNRTIHIRFSRDDEGYTLQAWGSAFPQDGGGGYRGKLNVKATTIDAGIGDLRSIWQEQVIEHHERNEGRKRFPFVEEWDLSRPADRGRLDRIGLTLARAGYTMFQLLFQDGDSGLKEIGDRLVQALRDDEQVITMESDDLFAPWAVLYVPPDDTASPWDSDPTWSMEGFWGYQHLVEHTFSRVPGFDSRVMVARDRVVVGLNIDDGVDEEHPPTPFIAPLHAFFTERTDVTVRREKHQLASALQDPKFDDHIMYFGCHAEVSGGESGRSYLMLGDGEKIYSSEIIAWLSGAHLPTKPFVFVSACQGGQMASLFYQAFGHHLLHYGARCLVGPQVDLPRAFALEYTTRLFTAFLQPGTKLGDIMRTLTREFADRYQNPLGLIFSMYRGIDIHLWRTEQQ